MALFNEILAPRYNRLLQRLLNMKGDAPAPQLAGDIMASIVLEADRPEYLYLQQTRLVSAARRQALTALAVSTFRIRNPASSGALGILTDFFIRVSASTVVNILIHNTAADLNNATRTVVRDGRYGMGNFGNLVFSSDNVAPAAGMTIHSLVLLTDVTFTLGVPIILPAGFGVDVSTGDINIALDVGAHGYERVAEASES